MTTTSRNEPVRVDPEDHDDDHPDQGGRVGAPATGTPGREQQTETEAPGKRPEGIAAIVRALFEGTRKVVEPKSLPVRLADETAWKVSVESAVVNIGSVIDRLIEELPDRVEIAPSEEISTMQLHLQSGVATQIVGRQPDRVRLQLTYRTDEETAPGVFIGAMGVTTGSGREVAEGETVTLDTRAAVYAVADASGARLDVTIEIGDRG